jgi:multicomponent Na+:H+ antiporter subunit A
LLAALLALHALLGLLVLLFAAPLGRRGLLVGVIAPAATVAWAGWNAPSVLDGNTITQQIAWVPGLGLDIDLRLDAFSLLMVGLVSGIGALVFVYALRYFGPSTRGVGRLAGLLTLFAGAMLGLVLADNLLLLYACWELTSITSYLLIGQADEDPDARAAALQALLITSAGGLAMLGGFVLLGQQAGTFQLSLLLADPPSGALVSVALVLVLLGAFTKSAQVPFHSWLPAAMVAPTPISAYLHSAAMVKAGVYLIARLAPVFAIIGFWQPLVVSVGLLTMIVGGLRALRPHDLKQLLAFGTISQLGFLVVLFGIGQPAATAAGCALLVAHALFKAALFMVVGIIDHQAGTRDIRALPTLGAGWTPTKVVAAIAAASMAGLPPLAGFLAKESAYEALLDGSLAERFVLTGIVAGSILTVAYSLRLVWGAFGTTPTSPQVSMAVARAATPPPPATLFLAPAGALAALTVLLGVAPQLFTELVDAGAGALDDGTAADLSLWHGFTVALLLSAVTVLAGSLLFLVRRRVEPLQARLGPRWSASRVYESLVRGLPRVADAVTGFVQPGSLPVYAAVILSVAAVVPLTGLVLGSWWSGWPALVGPLASVPIAALLIGGAVAAATAARRFTAALLLGSVGYGMALLFVLQGAPDLALTQAAIETLSIVLFLLVLRQLPDRFERRASGRSTAWRLVVSAMVGLLVFGFALAMSGARTARPVSEEMVERALPEAAGRNVVNVILVDFRGLDTLGEITVLVVAAVGATAVARAGRRTSRDVVEEVAE